MEAIFWPISSECVRKVCLKLEWITCNWCRGVHKLKNRNILRDLCCFWSRIKLFRILRKVNFWWQESLQIRNQNGENTSIFHNWHPSFLTGRNFSDEHLLKVKRQHPCLTADPVQLFRRKRNHFYHMVKVIT